MAKKWRKRRKFDEVTDDDTQGNAQKATLVLIALTHL